MFTNDNRRNRRFAAITTVAAAAVLVTTTGFAAPKREVGNGKFREIDVLERKVDGRGLPNAGPDTTTSGIATRFPKLTPEPEAFWRIVVDTPPSPFPGSDHDVTASGLRKKDHKNVPPQEDVFTVRSLDRGGKANDGPDITTSGIADFFPKLTPETVPFWHIVIDTPPSPFPGGDHDVTASGVRKHDRKNAPAQDDVFTVRQLDRRGAQNSGPDITTAAMTATATAEAVTGSHAGSHEGRTFLQSLDLTSSVRYVGASPVAGSARNPFADGRAWITLDRESQAGYVASAGWTFLLK